MNRARKNMTLIKVVLWRIVSIVITLAIMWVMTGDPGSATKFTFFLHSILTFVNYLFEILWDRATSDKL